MRITRTVAGRYNAIVFSQAATIGAACSLKIVRTNYGEGGGGGGMPVERNPESGASSANEPEKMRETREGMTVYKTDRAG